jgi:hypothetical protein
MSTVRLANQGNVVSPIKMDTFLINLPPETNWGKWALSKNEEPEAVMLERLKIWPLNGEIQGTTSILVAKGSVATEGWDISSKEHADNIRKLEAEVMHSQGTNQGKYEIEELIIDEIKYNGKKLYSMTWKATSGSAIGASFRRTPFVKGALYLYFPEDFSEKHRFYKFVITESYIPGTFISVDIEQIMPIIDGFVLIKKSS